MICKSLMCNITSTPASPRASAFFLMVRKEGNTTSQSQLIRYFGQAAVTAFIGCAVSAFDAFCPGLSRAAMVGR
jgi:hypothetical protein